MNDNEIYQKLTELKDQRIVACLATIVETAGSTPREAGAKMIICADGSLYGSVGGGCGESEVRSAALRSILTTQKPELLEIDLTDDIGTRDGDVCGGKMRIFVEPMGSR
jgi:xanthine dehydrogenase accessory factor